MPLSDPDLPPPPPGVPPAPGPPPAAPGQGGSGVPPPPGQFGAPGQPGQPGQWGAPGNWDQPPAQPYVPGGPPGGYSGYGPPPAEPGKRIWARVIDFVILVAFVIAVYVVLVVVLVADATSTSSTGVDSLSFSSNFASLAINFGIFIIYWVYESVMAATRGQTIGKMILGLRVVDTSGEKLTMGAAMKRSLVWPVLLVPCCIGAIAFLIIEIWGIVNIFNRPDRQTLMDQFADSTVTYA